MQKFSFLGRSGRRNVLDIAGRETVSFDFCARLSAAPVIESKVASGLKQKCFNMLDRTAFNSLADPNKCFLSNILSSLMIANDP